MNSVVGRERSRQSADIERDSCGVGFIADLQGRCRHDLLEMALTALSRMRHRGAVSADAETGDGAGVLFQLPVGFFRRELARQGIRPVPRDPLAVGMIFLPSDPDERNASKYIIEESIARRRIESLSGGEAVAHDLAEGGRHGRLRCLGWRSVPVNREVLGEEARAACPVIEQVFVVATSTCSGDELERTLFLVRKEIEQRLSEAGCSAYVVSLSHRTIVYKALLVSSDLRRFYPDLQRRDFRTRFAIFHGRYSTNTRPSWRLAQPFRFLAHNGEINTIQGNRRWIQARQEMLTSVWGDEAKWLVPILDEQGSDSASLDNVLELLFFSGRSLLHAIAMLVPEAYGRDPEKDAAVRAFYQYHECLLEPWDGPAALCFSDGRMVGAALDRNGLRPARYVITSDRVMVLASEVGVLPFDESQIIEKGRLGPGGMVAVDSVTGRFYREEEIKRRLARRRPYHRWLKYHLIEIQPNPRSPESNTSSSSFPLRILQRAFGYTHEDIDLILSQIVIESKEPVGSMGDDTPLPALSRKPRLLYDYFKQLFAQVTNPPIDPLRERLVMSLDTWIGPRSNWLREEPDACRVIHFHSPILTDEQFGWLTEQQLISVAVLSVRFPVGQGVQGLPQAIERLCARAETAVDEGAGILILSDRQVSSRWAPIPMLLAIGAVHQHLLRLGKRMRTSLIAEAGDAREDHHVACLIGYGADAVYPYLAYQSVAALAEEKGITDLDQAVSRYRQVLEKGLLKIMSKMGISVLSSYHGAQLFEAVGLAAEVISRCFSGTPSRIGGVGWEGLAADVLALHRTAFERDEIFSRVYRETKRRSLRQGRQIMAISKEASHLEDHGFYRYRKNGEYHAFNPTVIRALHRVVQSDEDCRREPVLTERDRAYWEAVEDRPPLALRDFLDFASPRRSIPVGEVEPVGEIVRRFCTSGMSHGALSREAHETLAIAMNRLGARSNSGEGGEDPARFPRPAYGDWAGNAIKQVASARFGVTPAYLASAEELEIKIAQGSKPGEGGQLPGHKVTWEIARLRHATPGIALISPPPHHDIYSIEDLAQLIYDLRQINPRARIAVKLVAEAGIGTIAAGVVKAGADVIHLSGHDGGTGASPLSSIKHAGVPWELGLTEVQRVLMANDLRGRVVLRVDGGLKTGRDVVLAAMLGADEFGFGTAALIALGCVMARQCHLNTCPVGIATQREDLRARFRGRPEHVVRFFLSVAQQVREILADLGFRRLEEVIGRTDLLKIRAPDGFVLTDVHSQAEGFAVGVPSTSQRGYSASVIGGRKNARLDLSFLLGADHARGPRARRFLQAVHRRHRVLDDAILQEALPALETAQAVHLAFDISNTDRTVGTKLAGEIVRRFGDKGVPERTIQITFRGTAGQSFGAFCVSGLRLVLFGDANDYVGKGMAGGEIIIRPSEEARFPWHENVIVGNTVLYGATGGRLFVAGRAGERFAVRNSGAVAVVEGVGDHGCEYMTGGVVVVLGEVGFNFAAGMTGGMALVLDEKDRLVHRINQELVMLSPLEAQDEEWLQTLLIEYWEATSSPRARLLLDSWGRSVAAVKKVTPQSLGQVVLPHFPWRQKEGRWNLSRRGAGSADQGSSVVAFGRAEWVGREESSATV